MSYDWLSVAGISPAEVPEVMVLEGTWWRQARERERLPVLDSPRELDAPDWWLGTYQGHLVMYACLYGAARAVEPVLMLGPAGVQAVIQIGSCGGLTPAGRTGEFLIPDLVLGADGVSTVLINQEKFAATPELATALASEARRRAFTVHTGPSVTETTLSQLRTDGMREQWMADGYLGMDMETAAVFAAAQRESIEHAALLYIWDQHREGKNWSDPLEPDIEARRRAAEHAMFEIAITAALSRITGRTRM